MSDARTAILNRIRSNKGAHEAKAESVNLDLWLQRRDSGPQPQWQEELQARFIAKLQQSGATVSRISTTEDIVNGVVQFRNQHDLSGPLVSAATTTLKAITWPEEVPVEFRAAQAEDQMIVTEAFCAMAETGSVVLRSGVETPTTLNYLPEYFICLVRTGVIVNWMENVWTLLRKNDMMMPRTINFITGPSRTADVEQTIQMGAHGPRHVHVMLLDD